uniref:Putative secreted protein n=1 Tax=Ixodes ricinus TaxID=34613 RepID=A0A6B0U6E6_IXORI
MKQLCRAGAPWRLPPCITLRFVCFFLVYIHAQCPSAVNFFWFFTRRFSGPTQVNIVETKPIIILRAYFSYHCWFQRECHQIITVPRCH